jgi:hypothetical protein
MIERIAILTFMVLFGVALIAMAPANAALSTDQAAHLQDTPAPTTPEPTVSVGLTAALVTSTPAGAVPVTDGGEPTPSTMIIIGLLVILGMAIFVGGLALMRRPH